MAVVIGFFICWAPFHAQRLLYVYGKNLPRYTEINEKMYYITGCFYYFSATINPILYNVMSARYREAFCETLCGCQSQLDKPRDPYADRCQSITSFNSLQQSTINKHPNQKKIKNTNSHQQFSGHSVHSISYYRNLKTSKQSASFLVKTLSDLRL